MRLTKTRLRRQHKCLADFAQSSALRSFTKCGFEALNWFPEWFKAKPEGLMVHRHNEASACGIRHLNCLLGGAVGPYPWIVSADRHDRDIDRAVSPSFCE